MNETLRLMAWLSPAFPVGAFGYSHGLERAVHDGVVTDGKTLRGWLAALVEHGSGWNDAVLFAEAWRLGRDVGATAGTPTPYPSPQGGGGFCTVSAFPPPKSGEQAQASPIPLPLVGRGEGWGCFGAAGEQDLAGLAELGAALAGSAERLLETGAQGGAFAAAMAEWGGAVALPDDCPYPIAVGAHAGAAGLRLETALAAFLQAFVTNLVQAGIRLGLLGQHEAVRLVASFEAPLAALAARAARSTLDDLGTATLAAEIASMRHETQHSRLFRT